ncbi:MAG: SPFH domain-containing protein [Succinivibrionaceae bacterium]|nr:SPFH domain-containing protein [Succinivibrionaceae bacterium]
MGLIKAAAGAVLGTMADQWKEFFTCSALDNDTLMARGRKQTSARSSNTNGHDNVISNGSGIAVADGQCVLIIDQGEVRDVVAEPGLFTYDKGSSPSIFAGSLGQGVKDLIKTSWERFKMGGDTGRDQRVYYINLKEILDNKFGTANPIPFHIVDARIGMDMDFSVRCNGMYTFKITDPVTFYTKICGNVEGDYEKETLVTTMKQEFVSALNGGFGKLSNLGIRPYALPQHVDELTESLNEILSKKWSEARGISVVSVAINSVNLPEEEAQMLKEVQRAAALSNPMLAGGFMAGQTGAAMQAAASNPNGAVGGFMGMGMANAMGAGQIGGLFAAGQQQQAAGFGAPAAPAAGGWACSCGATNTGKFCNNCGKPQPAPAGSWTCGCGASNTGKFCSNCGQPQPAPAGSWTCSCGTSNTGNFCNNCGSKRP